MSEKGDTDPGVPVGKVVKNHLGGLICSKVTGGVAGQPVKEKNPGVGREVDWQFTKAFPDVRGQRVPCPSDSLGGG